jgi:hypothetical protein
MRVCVAMRFKANNEQPDVILHMPTSPVPVKCRAITDFKSVFHFMDIWVNGVAELYNTV